MGLAWQQGPLAAGAVGHFLTPQPVPERILYAEPPLRRRMRVKFGDQFIADSEKWCCFMSRRALPISAIPLGTPGSFKSAAITESRICQ
jgi:hypothetical protein